MDRLTAPGISPQRQINGIIPSVTLKAYFTAARLLPDGGFDNREKTVMGRMYLSAEGLQKLHERLEELRKRMTEVVAEIEHARGLGDLRENAEYHAAKEEQALLHARIRDLEDQIARAEVLDPNKVDMTKAYVGARVRVRNVAMNTEEEWTLVSPVESDIQQRRLSVQSPVGSALLGKGVGEIAVAKVPAGEIQFEILEITYDV